MFDIIGYTVWVKVDGEVEIHNFELDQEDEAERFAGAFDEALLIPLVNI